jgi:predicted DNA-binding transcriptional regulator AlpA
MHTLTTKPPRFVSYDELRTLYGETRSRTQLRRAVEAGKYPAPKQLSPQRIGWESSKLDAHYDARPTVVYAGKRKHAA